jgi:hypothetical protein
MEAVIGAGSCEIWRGLLYIFSGRTIAALPIYTIT